MASEYWEKIRESIGDCADNVIRGIGTGTTMLHNVPQTIKDFRLVSQVRRARPEVEYFYDSWATRIASVATIAGEAAVYCYAFGLKGLLVPAATNLLAAGFRLKDYLKSRKSKDSHLLDLIFCGFEI
jgi:hypothetical protein